MNTKSILIALSSLLLFVSCTGKTKQPKEETLWDDSAIVNNSAHATKAEITEKKDTVDNDRIYYFEDLQEIKETPRLAGPKEYFRKNNKFKDWDANDPKQVFLEYIVEKNGTASNVEIKESSGIKKLDDEALRLIKEAEYLPGTNHKGEPIRCGNMMNHVFFPPK